VYQKIALPNITPEQNKFQQVMSFCGWKRNLEEQGGFALKALKEGLPCWNCCVSLFVVRRRALKYSNPIPNRTLGMTLGMAAHVDRKSRV